MKRDNTGKWVAGVGMGIGSAALVAALLYANRGKPDAKKKKRPAPEPTD